MRGKGAGGGGATQFTDFKAFFTAMMTDFH